MSHEHHHHSHAHNHHSFTEANEHHFDAEGLEILGNEQGKTIGRQAAEAFLSAAAFDKDKTDVLDFACGIGRIPFSS